MGQQSKHSQATKTASANEDKVSVLRTALRSAPQKKRTHARSPLKAAIAQLLPDLIAFRAKGYSGADLAEIMRDHGFVVSVRTLNKYVNEARTRSGEKRKKKAAPAALGPTTAAVDSEAKANDAAKTIVVPPSLLATKAPTRSRRVAKEVLGHRFDDDL